MIFQRDFWTVFYLSLTSDRVHSRDLWRRGLLVFKQPKNKKKGVIGSAEICHCGGGWGGKEQWDCKRARGRRRDRVTKKGGEVVKKTGSTAGRGGGNTRVWKDERAANTFFLLSYEIQILFLTRRSWISEDQLEMWGACHQDDSFLFHFCLCKRFYLSNQMFIVPLKCSNGSCWLSTGRRLRLLGWRESLNTNSWSMEVRQEADAGWM